MMGYEAAMCFDFLLMAFILQGHVMMHTSLGLWRPRRSLILDKGGIVVCICKLGLNHL
jgi:hypothetical protein